MYEYAGSVAVNDNTDVALYCLNNSSLKDLAVFLCGYYLEPVSVVVNSLLVESCKSINITYAYNKCFNGVADLEHLSKLCRGIVCYLFSFDDSRDLCANVELKLGVVNSGYVAGNNVSCI